MQPKYIRRSTGYCGLQGYYFARNTLYKKQSLEKLGEFLKNGGRVLCVNPDIVCGAKKYSITSLYLYRDIECDNKNIRVIKRTGKKDNVYILYNESDKVQTFAYKFNESLGNCYRLDSLTGSVYKFFSQNEITLLSGEECVVLFTDVNIDTAQMYQKDKLLSEAVIDTCQKLERVTLNNGKFIKTPNTGSMREWEKDYTGTVCYSGTFKAVCKRAVIVDMGRVNYHCTLYINGTQVGMCVMPPYELYVDGSLIKENNTIEIVVSNTCANEIYYLKDGTLPDKMFSVYKERTHVFEKDSLPSGLMSEVKVYSVKH